MEFPNCSKDASKPGVVTPKNLTFLVALQSIEGTGARKFHIYLI